jgi:D-tagatose-1,6-bisphosphate aldolase subunit GatZ/KbaZ
MTLTDSTTRLNSAPLNSMIRTLIELRASGKAQVTLLAVCPNSDAVLEAAVQVAAANRTPMLFAATLNQVDRDGGYTGWTAAAFVERLKHFGARYHASALYPCLDHGGPWLKDAHTKAGLDFATTMNEVKASLAACLEAGYALLHIDPTVDRTRHDDEPVPIPLVVERTLELIAFAEDHRSLRGLPPVAYEVGTEEVHGGLVNMDSFIVFLRELYDGLATRNLLHAWPCFVVGKVGTDLHTVDFDPQVAQQLFDLVMPYGSLVVGPEFTADEYLALAALVAKERALAITKAGLQPSRLLEALENAVYRSNRWQKWLQPEERAVTFADLDPKRRAWLVQTGARYIWTDSEVQAARRQLYANLAPILPDPHQYVVQRIARAIDAYVNSFGLFNANALLDIGN